MDPEINRRLQALFDAHDDAIRALRAANTKLALANSNFSEAIQAHDDAIQAALVANRAAIDLLRHLSNGQASQA